MKAKKYIFIILFLISLFILLHFIIWNIYLSKIYLNSNNTIGDLGRMSYLEDSFFYREKENNLKNKHINFTKIENIDVLTLGDSFSNGGAGGLNAFYQDFIATNNNYKVMNIQPINSNFIETIMILNNNGILAKLNPRVIILQSVERYAINRYSKNIDWNKKLDYHKTIELLKGNNQKHKNISPFFINNLNYNYLIYPILYSYDDNAFFSKVFTANLNQNLFSGTDNKLLFFEEDIFSVKFTNIKNIKKLNYNLNKLQLFLDEHGIKLYFMPCVDKYNLYSKYMTSNPYPKSSFFELLRKEKKEYNFIDTKKILLDLIEDGEKDVFYQDDTHWSYKASEKIFDKIKFNSY